MMCHTFGSLVLGTAVIAFAQTDPGPRPGLANAGNPIVGLNPEEENLFWTGWGRFKEAVSVSGEIEKGIGLGPVFNGNSCLTCHAQPAAGGSSSSPRSPQVRKLALEDGRLALSPQPNPQVALATLDRPLGKGQAVPPFISPDGPVRVPHLIKRPDGTPDGSVRAIYSIAGRVDALGCTLPQPDFAHDIASSNVAFRIPTPTFGGGLIEAVPDAILIANFSSTTKEKKAVGIGGHFNRAVKDGRIARFGWKAQHRDLLSFAAESYNVEEGVTSVTFPEKRDHTPGCLFNSLPEDKEKLERVAGEVSPPPRFVSDVVSFAGFMRLLAPPEPAVFSDSAQSGSELFNSIGCSLCHSPTIRTASSTITGMSHIQIHPYSDFALHHMGPGLADHISQGLAAGDEFRTAPLWGVGQRLFFLHDGRTSDLLVAIEAHASMEKNCRANPLAVALHEACESEANEVIAKFNGLPGSWKQDILNFLRSL
jgi:CxxC motif-containing protein (DUF1111 family)